MLALGAAAPLHAQTADKADPAVLPVWDKDSGRLEGILLLQPTGAPVAGRRWGFGKASLDAAFGLDANDSLGLVCDRKNGLVTAISNLANHCLLAAFDGDRRGTRDGSAGIALSQGNNRLGVSLGSGRDSLPAWLSPNGQASQVDQNALMVLGQRNLGREATVSIGGSVARARLYPAGEIPSQYADRWTTRSLSVGGTLGKFGASVIGRVVEVPGQPGKWEGVGLGLSWRTPWSGQLTVGAENIVTRGKNPFSPNAEEDEGTVPYVRYEQDL
ncbi:MAG TPA: hypothetical protein VEY50_02780 [Lysobacter sp.]|nr:hypothetical protein [Lysobacter sp.]